MAIAKEKETLTVTSPAFEDGGYIPEKYTGRGEDVSPPLTFSKLHEKAQSIAIMLDDINHPIPNYNHWVIWNLPLMKTLPEGVPHGEVLPSFDGAVQGVGYGKHRYKGPKPPFGTHKYIFKVYVLDTTLGMYTHGKKRDLIYAMQGHVLQYGSITGLFKNKK